MISTLFCLDHVCAVPGSKKVLVLDGNMKNARQVSMVKDVAELHFAGMPSSLCKLGGLPKKLHLVTLHTFIRISSVKVDTKNVVM